MSDARAGILGRLRAVRRAEPERPDVAAAAAKAWTADERVVRLRAAMTAVRTEFLEATRDGWPEAVRAFLAAESVDRVAHGTGPEPRRLGDACARAGAPEAVAYDRPVEDWKAALFDGIDAGFTAARCAIAETGTLVLWPSPGEPRLLSLLPPLHVALLSAATVRDTFLDVIRGEGWARGLPPNVVLVSGPSKTADIEQTLAYGVHGPKRLVVVLVP